MNKHHNIKWTLSKYVILVFSHHGLTKQWKESKNQIAPIQTERYTDNSRRQVLSAD